MMNVPVDIFGPRQFLLVEDFETMRGVIRGLLKRCGAIRVDTAATGEEAARMLSKNSYDVILCDYNLGVGRNGQMLLEEARFKRWISPASVWIMITAEKSSDMISVAAEQAPDDYLLKPITEGTLQTRLQRLVARKSALADIMAAMEAKEHAKALSLCNQRLAEGKHAAELLRLQAQIFENAGDTTRAAAAYHAVLDRADVAWAKLGLAKLKAQAGDDAGARKMMEDIVTAHPQYLEAYDGLARLLERKGESSLQFEVLQRASSLSPNSSTRQAALGSAAAKNGKLDVAAQAFQRSIKLSEHSALKTAAPMLGLARVQIASGAQADALQTLANVEQGFAAEAETQLLAKSEALRAHVKLGHTEEAQAIAKQVMQLTLNASEPLSTDAAFQVAESLMESGQQSLATELLQFVTRNNHDDQSVAERAQKVFESGGMGDAGRELLTASRKEAAEAMTEGVKLIS